MLQPKFVFAKAWPSLLSLEPDHGLIYSFIYTHPRLCYLALQFLNNGHAPLIAELLKFIRYIMNEASEELRCLTKYINNIQTVF